MRNLILAATATALVLPVATVPAAAQSTRREAVREVRQDCRQDLRYARTQAERRRIERQCRREVQQVRRDWRQYRNYDYNRYEPGVQGYYADRYYRDGRYYGETRLSRNDRIYRGNDGRYYCRRSDGTTGLIIGGAVGALLANAIDNGRSSILGTLIGGGVGAALGQQVARGNVRCR